MKILAGFEESQAVCKAFRELGHEAYSNDLQDCSGDKPEWHLKMDARKAVGLMKWDLGIFFVPCTDLAVSGAKHFWYKVKNGQQEKSIKLFMEFTNLPFPSAIENPIGIMSTLFRKPDQIIQPWMFGHGEVKRTCLWLNGLPLLAPTNIVEGREPKVWKMAPSKDRAKLRSKTYTGIAQAMALQWSNYLSPLE